ncbi:MAG: glycosyl hydrolase 115 family protein, partial [Lachnospiraceae bacterium]|nr:glycosyl hydrolase 115 family protein [Lachnospiraceae bacterium]
MEFVFNRYNIQEKKLAFVYEEEALSGVKKIADKVRNDIKLVFSEMPSRIEHGKEEGLAYPVIFGTIGHSHILDELNEKGLIRLSDIKGRREVYSFSLVNIGPETETALVIAGSDKRGTIYGLFHLSELLKVSPLVDWCDVKPDKMVELVLNEEINMVSKEPSVKYRGFFINDEWPAFGNWATRNFGGFNAGMYEHVFELLLRLKGNY